MQVQSLPSPASEHEHADLIRSIAQQLWSTEEAVDRALRENALLVVSMLDGRIAAGLAPCAVQRALAPVSASNAALFQTRANVLEAHTELRRMQKRLGATEVRLGGLNKDDHDGPRTDEIGPWPFARVSNVVPHPAAAA